MKVSLIEVADIPGDGIVKVTVNTVFQLILADQLLPIFHDFLRREVARGGAASRFTQLP